MSLFFKKTSKSKQQRPSFRRDTRQIIPLQNRFDKLASMRQKEIDVGRDQRLPQLELTKDDIQILGTMDPKGKFPRLILLVRLKTPYIDLLGQERNWIPFYRSSGQFSGDMNKGGFFSFYGMWGLFPKTKDLKTINDSIQKLKKNGINFGEKLIKRIKRQGWFIKCNFNQIRKMDRYKEIFNQLFVPYYSNKSYTSLKIDFEDDRPEDLGWENLIFTGAKKALDDGENSGNLFAVHGDRTKINYSRTSGMDENDIRIKRIKLCNPYFDIYSIALDNFFENKKNEKFITTQMKEISATFYQNEDKNINDLIGNNTIFGFNLNDVVDKPTVKKEIDNIIRQIEAMSSEELKGVANNFIEVAIKLNGALPLWEDVVEYIINKRKENYLIKGGKKKSRKKKRTRKRKGKRKTMYRRKSRKPRKEKRKKKKRKGTRKK